FSSFILVRVINSANGDQIYPQVYDFVIFRGSDLQEVSVRELTPQDILVENDSAAMVFSLLAVRFKPSVMYKPPVSSTLDG
ncbi:hypothetical protein TSMEX_001091, partial [Taenia solium]